MIYTVEQFADRESWLAGRRRGIGASETPAVYGISPFKGDTAFALWLDKTGQEFRELNSEAAQSGLDHEPSVAVTYSRLTGAVCETPPPNSFCRSIEFPWLTASVDRFVTLPDGGRVIGQIKCVSIRGEKHWASGKTPLNYRVQVQQEMLVTGLSMAHIIVFFGARLKTDYFEVPRDDDFLGKLVKKTKRFWGLVESRTPPKMDGSEDTRSRVERAAKNVRTETAVELPEGLAGLLGRLKTSETLLESLTADVNATHSEILSHLTRAGAVAGLVNGQPRCEIVRGKLKLI